MVDWKSLQSKGKAFVSKHKNKILFGTSALIGLGILYGLSKRSTYEEIEQVRLPYEIVCNDERGRELELDKLYTGKDFSYITVKVQPGTYSCRAASPNDTRSEKIISPYSLDRIVNDNTPIPTKNVLYNEDLGEVTFRFGDRDSGNYRLDLTIAEDQKGKLKKVQRKLDFIVSEVVVQAQPPAAPISQPVAQPVPGQSSAQPTVAPNPVTELTVETQYQPPKISSSLIAEDHFGEMLGNALQ